MNKQFKVAVVGATGAVGETMLAILAERRFPVSEVVALASERSAGGSVKFGEQDIVVRYARERAIETLPKLLGERADRERLLAFMDKLGADPRLFGRPMSAHDRDVVESVRRVLGAAPPRLAAVKKKNQAA